MVELLGPEQPRERLAHDALGIVRELLRDHRRVELVRLAQALGEYDVEVLAECAPWDRRVGESQAHRDALPGGQGHPVARRRLRADGRGVDRVFFPIDDASVDAVLHVRARVRLAPEPLAVRLVLGEEELGRPLAVEPAWAQRFVLGLDQRVVRDRAAGAKDGARGGGIPGPGVAKPHRREEVQPCGLGAAIRRGDPDQEVVGRRLRVLDQHVEVAVPLEDARVHQLELGRAPVPPPVLLDEPRVRKLRLRVLVEELHVGVRRRRVEVEVVLLDVLAVVALASGQPEQPLLQDRVSTVPEGQGEAEPAVVVGDPTEPVLAPPVGARARVVVGEGVPGGAVGAVVLAHRAPLALGEVGSPALPVGGPFFCFLEPGLFPGHAIVPLHLQITPSGPRGP